MESMQMDNVQKANESRSGSSRCSVSAPLTFGSLFAGIGGIDLGFERAGLVCKWQVEIATFQINVLKKHWPEVPRHDDIRTFIDIPYVDVIAGGFPCQDISNAGKRKGIDGDRSGLWSEYARVIREVRPRFVVVENVAALLVRGNDRVLRDLADCGYDAEWQVVPASGFGIPQPRKRVFIVAYSHKFGTGNRVLQQSWPKLRPSCDTEASDSRGWSTWTAEPAVPRMAHGIPNRLDRVAAIGNAVVPQVAEYIGRCIVAAAD